MSFLTSSPWRATSFEHELVQTIQYRLLKGSAVFPVLCGIAANAAFLGRVEIEEFKALADDISFAMRTEDTITGKRATFCGMEIFPVDEPSYFSVGLTHSPV